jgi:hypothetical protein
MEVAKIITDTIESMTDREGKVVVAKDTQSEIYMVEIKIDNKHFMIMTHELAGQ